MRSLNSTVLRASVFFGAVLSVSLRSALADAPTDGKWDNVLALELQPIHMVLLKNKLVLAIGGQDDAPNPCILFDTTTDDPSAPFLTPHNPVQPADALHNLFCSGHAALPDGRVVFNGGEKQKFGNKTTTYDPDDGATTEAFEVLADISPAYRFYPTLTALADGLWCTVGDSTCDGEGHCTGGDRRCEAGELCLESTQTCLPGLPPVP